MNLSEATATLATTPKVLHTLLSEVPADSVYRNDGAGTWSAYDIVGHLLNGDATNWLPRARMILEHGTARSFQPFDRVAMLGWERRPVTDLLADFQATRRSSVEALSSMDLGPGDLPKRGLHPDLGEVTLGQLLSSWVAHDLTHVAQIGEVLARGYRDDVGPWRVYMPALDRVAAAE